MKSNTQLAKEIAKKAADIAVASRRVGCVGLGEMIALALRNARAEAFEEAAKIAETCLITWDGTAPRIAVAVVIKAIRSRSNEQSV